MNSANVDANKVTGLKQPYNEREIVMADKKNLYPKIEQSVTITQLTIGDKDGLKFGGLKLTPNMASLLTAWQAGKAEIKLTLQQTQAELPYEEKPGEPHPMEKPQAQTKSDKAKNVKKDDTGTKKGRRIEH